MHGKRDEEAERKRIEKAQANGFGQPGVAGRPKKDFTEIIEERAAKRIESITDKALDAFERALKSGSEKTALDAANKYLNNFYRPVKKVDVTGKVEHSEAHVHLLKGQNSLSDKEQKLLGEFLDVLKQGVDEAEVIEVEVIEETSSKSEEQ